VTLLSVLSSGFISISEGINADPNKALETKQTQDAVSQLASHDQGDDYPGTCDQYRNDDDEGYDFWIGETGRSKPIFTGPQQYPLDETRSNEKPGI
jgi:hypothetical protein